MIMIWSAILLVILLFSTRWYLNAMKKSRAPTEGSKKALFISGVYYYSLCSPFPC